ADYNPSAGWGLSRSDGTPGGTGRVINTGTSLTFPTFIPSQLNDVNGTLYFTLHDQLSRLEQLWKSNGTSQTTVLVKDFTPAPGTPFSATEFTPLGDRLLFKLITPSTSNSAVDSGEALWVSDGTSGGTVM